MKTVLLALLFSGSAVLAQTMPYQDAEFGCIDVAQAQRYVQDFKIDVASFGGMELCNPQVDTKKLLNDIQILENGRFDSANTQNKFIRGFVDSSNYYAWMKSETRGVERGQDIPYATAYNSGGYFTMQDGWAKLSTLGRVGTFVHEARHTEGYRHIQCTQGSYQGTSVAGCDTSYSYGGSHAVEMEYYARVAVQGVNFHPVYKKMARLMAIARSNIFFNTPIIQPREAVLALATDRKSVGLYDQGQWVTREVPDVPGRLKRTSYGAVLFDGLRAFAIELYENSGFTDPVSDTYSYFKLLSEKDTAVKDMEEFDSGIKRYVVKVSTDNKLAAYDFPNGVWGRDQNLGFDVVNTSTAVPGVAQSGYYLVSQAGDVYAYQPQNGRVVSQNKKWDFDNVSVINYNNQSLMLKSNGHIFTQSSTGEVKPWSEANEIYSALVTTPVYDGFEVKKQ